jgi:serine/threonine protein kinase
LCGQFCHKKINAHRTGITNALNRIYEDVAVMGKRHKKLWGRWSALGPPIFEGGQGRLYPVEDSQKTYKGSFILKELKNPRRVERFRRELEILTKIRHPNVIELIDASVFLDETKPWYVMERAIGSLATELANYVGNYSRIIDLFAGICRGLAHLHSSKVIHRDLKPENILITGDQTKIADLGLALVITGDRLTPTSEAVGPRLYMAPELEDGRNLDVTPSADIYSMGKILYFMLSGGQVFAREKLGSPKFDLARQAGDSRIDLFIRSSANPFASIQETGSKMDANCSAQSRS